MTMRRQHRAEFKAKVALEALRGERMMNELAAAYGVHPVHITQWKKVVLEEVPQLFSRRRGSESTEEEALKAALYQQIGQLKVELDWLKKNWASRVRRNGSWESPNIGGSACGANVSCWGWPGGGCTISRWAPAPRIGCFCGCWTSHTRPRRALGSAG